MPTIDDPGLEAISDTLRFLAARAGQGVVAELPRNPFSALERLRARLVPPTPAGRLLEHHEIHPRVCGSPGFHRHPGARVERRLSADMGSGRRRADDQCRCVGGNRADHGNWLFPADL